MLFEFPVLQFVMAAAPYLLLCGLLSVGLAVLFSDGYETLFARWAKSWLEQSANASEEELFVLADMAEDNGNPALAYCIRRTYGRLEELSALSATTRQQGNVALAECIEHTAHRSGSPKLMGHPTFK